MDSNAIEAQRREAERDMLERAGAFEQLIRSKGWEWLQGYYQAKIQTFTTTLLLSAQPIASFEAERQQLVGMKELFDVVKSDLDQLAAYRKEQDAKQA